MPVFDIQTPDGRTFEVDAPDMQTAIESLSALGGENAQQPQQQPQPETPQIGKMESFLRGGAQGLTVNLADEMAGGGAQKQAMLQAATDRDRLAAMQAAANEGDWDTYRSLQKQVFAKGTEAQTAATNAYRVRDVLAAQQNPGSYVTGEIGGALGVGALTGGAGAAAPGAGLGTRMGMGALQGAGYGAAYGAGGATEGNRLSGAASGAAFGAAGGAVVPAVMAGVGAGVNAIGNRVTSTVRGLHNPTAEAQARVGSAMARDAGATAINQTDEAAAALNGQPIMNVDRGGETTRALARASANASPEARAAFERTTSDRFETQGSRAIRLLQRITGNTTDDLALQRQIEDTARRANKKAYDAAYAQNFGQVHSVALDTLQTRIPADAIRNAMRVAKAEGRPFGEQLIASIDDATNSVTFRRAPSLREWDYIQRGLRASADSAYRGGAGEVGTAYSALRRDLLGVLDDANPLFKKARQGAANAFGAEDALDAGRIYARTTRNTGEMMNAIRGMTPAEKKVFQTGYASELIDRIKATRDRANVINQVFGSQEARDKIRMTFGDYGAKQVEAFTRVEAAMDLMRGALGNSTTARQLVELGLVGGGTGGAYGLATGDWNTAAIVGAGVGAARYGGQRVNAKINDAVLKEIGRILISNDQAAITKLVNNAAASAQHMAALRMITDGVLSRLGPVIGEGAAAMGGVR